VSNNIDLVQESPEDFETFSRTTKTYYKEIETYDWVAITDHFRGLESLFHWNRQRVMRNLLRRYGQGNRYLDVGCGTGLILRHLPPGSVGLDINPRNLPLAKGYAPQTHLVLGDAEDILLAANTFSTVICTEVLEHLPDPAAAVREIKRILKPGGVLVGSVPSPSIIWRFRFLSSTCPRDEPFHREYRFVELEQLLRPLEVIKVWYSLLRMNLLFVAQKADD